MLLSDGNFPYLQASVHLQRLMVVDVLQSRSGVCCGDGTSGL